MEIAFNQLPPSENKIRIIRVIRGRPGGMAYTKEASNYKKDFKAAMLKEYAAPIVQFAKEHKFDSAYKVKIVLYFDRSQLINKGWPNTKTYIKKMDVGNRRKLLEDCLAEVLGIDDMFTFDLQLVKRACNPDANFPYEREPGAHILIKRVDLGSYGL